MKEEDYMGKISLNFEANDLSFYGFEAAEQTDYGFRFINGSVEIYYEAESETYLITQEGHILYNGKISSHGFCKQLFRSIGITLPVEEGRGE